MKAIQPDDPKATRPTIPDGNLRQTKITAFLRKNNTPQDNSSESKEPATSKPKLDVATLKPNRAGTKPKCKYCPYLEKSGSIACHFNGQSYPTKTDITCCSALI